MASYKTGSLSGFNISADNWEKSSGGNICKAQRKSDGATVFIKQYTLLKEPIRDESTSHALYNKKLAKFERFVKVRSEVNKRMRMVSGRGGNIIIPYDEFVCDHLYTEVSNFIPGLMKPDEILALSDDEKMKFAMTAVNALEVVHEQKVIHIDIKPDNVIAVRNASNMVVGKIIDFDNSLLMDLPIPTETGGDLVHQSPELAYYAGSEGDPEVAKLISEKTDIFSMGITLHFYLSGGKYPRYIDIEDPQMRESIQEKETNGKPVYPWEVSLGDGKLVMDRSLPDWIAAIIAKMTDGDPDKRPTCHQVFQMFIDRPGSVADAFDPPRSIDTVEWLIDKLKADGYTGIHFSVSMRKYELTRNRSVLKRMNMSELQKAGYAKTIEIEDEFETPRASDRIEWDIEMLKKKGYTGIHPVEGGKYRLSQNGKTLSTCVVSFLVSHGFAKRVGDSESVDPVKTKSGTASKDESVAPPKRTPPMVMSSASAGFEDPDPEDGILRWNIDRLLDRMYDGIHSEGDGKYTLFSKGRPVGTYDKDKLIKLKYAIPGAKKEKDAFDMPDPADGIREWNAPKLESRGYTGIRSLGGGKYMLISNGRQQGIYEVERLLILGYALK